MILENKPTSQGIVRDVPKSSYAQLEPDSLNSYQLTRERERREIKRLLRYVESEHASIIGDANLIAHAFSAALELEYYESQSYETTISCSETCKWKESTKDEMSLLIKNKTWIIVPRPKDVKLVTSRWLYRKKDAVLRAKLPRYKSRLVAKGFTQREGIYFNEIYSPMVKHTSIRTLLSIMTHGNMEIEALDVNTTFLYGPTNKV